MDLYSQLSEALRSPERDLERILKEAAAAGTKPIEALKALHQMYDEALERDNERDQDLIGDYSEIVKGYCQPECRIWSKAESEEMNARLTGWWE